MSLPFELKVLEKCKVSPPANSVPTTFLPLTFFDIPWLLCRPMKRVFVYDFECSAVQFGEDVLPMIKQSLSVALELFFPICGNLVCPPHPRKPHILYSDGDFVTLTVAECGGVFDDLVRGGLRDAKEIHPLVSPLPPSSVSHGSAEEITPVLALQVTLFPNSGICIGIHFNHVIADGKACHHFLKTWAYIFKSKCNMPCIYENCPIIDRSVIKDINGIEDVLLGQWRGWGSPCWKEDVSATPILEDMVRSTFVLTREDIEKLKNWVSVKCMKANKSLGMRISSFVVACALTWVCVIKSQDAVTFVDEDLCHFCFVADCRNRNELSIPSLYFGNCLSICFVTVKRGTLRGEDSIALAAEAIGRKVQDLDNGLLLGAEKWLTQWEEVSKTGDLLTVAGSQRLAVYDTDFGWGRPKLVELIQIDASGAMSLSETRDGKSGVEMGLSRSRTQMFWKKLMATQLNQVKVLEQCQISPPPNSVPTTSLPITCLDIPLFMCCPVQRVFLYQVPYSAIQFSEEVLPHLKNSLSLALQRFFPFCGNTVCPPEPEEPYILYNEGDSVPFLIARSTGSFSDFLRDGPKDVVEIHPLLPPTPPTSVSSVTLVEIVPHLAVKITLFPNLGLAVGITYRHTVADGMSFMHFIKTWASIQKAGCGMSRVCISLPDHDKGVVKNLDGRNVFLEQWRAWGSPIWKESATLLEDNVRATFTLSRVEIDRLKKWVVNFADNGSKTAPDLHISSYVVTCAFIWGCLIKSLDVITAYDSSKDEELCHFAIAADCRNKYGLGLPTAYIGNGICGKLVSVARYKFREEDCFTSVAEAISRGVQSFKDGPPLDGYKCMLSKLAKLLQRGENFLTVASSPKLADYDTNFGWGRPDKVEVVHIDTSGSISLSESRNEKGGLEIGICQSRHQMELFTTFFEKGLKQFE